jgi:hypothetical protein
MPMDVRGQWQIIQTSGHVVNMDIREQDGDGTFADQGEAQEAHSGKGRIKDAKATDSQCAFLIEWDNGAKGRYSGQFDFQGRLSGVCHDEAHPSAVASWVAKRPPNDLFGPR